MDTVKKVFEPEKPRKKAPTNKVGQLEKEREWKMKSEKERRKRRPETNHTSLPEKESGRVVQIQATEKGQEMVMGGRPATVLSHNVILRTLHNVKSMRVVMMKNEIL